LNESEKKHYPKTSSKSEKRNQKYGAVAMLLENDLEEDYEDSIEGE